MRGSMPPLPFCLQSVESNSAQGQFYIITSRNTRRCSGGPQNKVRIHGSDLTLTYFRHHELLAGCLATHKHAPASTLTNNGARRDSRFYVTAR
jgi:hypothetical protein